MLSSSRFYIIDIVTGSYNPFKVRISFGIGSLWGRFCLACLWEVVFVEVTFVYIFFGTFNEVSHHCKSLTIFGSQSVGSFCIVSKEDYINAVIGINPQVSGFAIAYTSYNSRGIFFGFIKCYCTGLIQSIIGIADGEGSLNFVSYLIIIILTD